MTMANNWYTFTAKADAEADVHIYSEIGGFGVSAEAFVNELKTINAKRLNVRINSPGGSVFDGFAIFNALRGYKGEVVTYVDGLAASAASVIAIAGRELRIAKNGYLMIHNAAAGVWGGADDMRKTADLLEKLNGTIADAYSEKTKRSRDEMLALMESETWMNAKDAKDMGFVDAIEGESDELPSAVAQAFKRFENMPAKLKRLAAQYIEKNGQGVSSAADTADAQAANAQNVGGQMTLEQFKSFAAEHPEAVTQFIEQGKKAARADARKELKDLIEAANGDLAVAVRGFELFQDADTVKATLEAVAKATADNAAKLAAAQAEIEKLKAQVGTQSAVVTSAATGEATTKAQIETKTYANATEQAKDEWANMGEDDKAKWASEKVYIRARVRELGK
jgi:ATP-dependent Clp endopeptidase proteolytic subunit ClpP